MDLTNFGENSVLNAIFVDPALPWSGAYIGLITAVSNIETGSVTEVSGTGYARVQATAAIMNAASSGSKSNGTAITFPSPGANDWGTITHFGLWDAASSGNLIAAAALTNSRTPLNGDTVEFPIGSFTMTAD